MTNIIPPPVHPRLGRIPSLDPRDKKHPLSAITPQRATVATRYWRTGPVLDQGSQPHCVAFAWAQFLLSAPSMTRLTSPTLFARALYMRAQELDEWEGSNYDGTSVRGGVKALEEQHRIKEYLWTKDEDVIRRYVLSRGGLVLGVDWYTGFFEPKKIGGEYWLEPSGVVEGGHAIYEKGYSEKRSAHRWLNSWGKRFAYNGAVWIHRDVLKDLSKAEGFEACSAVEKPLPA